MNQQHSSTIRTLFLFIGLFLTSWTRADITAQWSSDVVIPGEQTYLLLIESDGTPIGLSKAPYVSGMTLEAQGSGRINQPNNPNGYASLMVIGARADKPGSITIPPLEVQTQSGKTVTVAVPPLTVCPFDQVQWKDDPIPYGILWYARNKEPYVMQPLDVVLKLYIPRQIQDWKLPPLQGTGLSVSRFSQVMLDFMPAPVAQTSKGIWRALTWHGTITPLREGDTSIKGSIIMYVPTETNRPSFIMQTLQPYELPLSGLSLRALPLPLNAPAGYANAVGEFSIKADTDARDLSANELVSVRITVSGQGNLDQLTCPDISDPAQWKLNPPNKIENRDAMGNLQSVTFQLNIRPTEEVPGIPAFTMSYFDPQAREYKTIGTRPIALPWKASADTMSGPAGSGSTAPPPAGAVPVEELVDIYDLPPAETIRERISIPNYWLWICYIPTLALLAYLGTRTWLRWRNTSIAQRQRLTELKNISSIRDSVPFLRALGAYIEAHIPRDRMNDSLEQILKQRDEEAFKPDSHATALSHDQRNGMLHAVKTAVRSMAALALMALAALGSISQAQDSPADKSYKAGQYSQAISQYEQALREIDGTGANPARFHYGIGNANYRLNKPGHAALAYARALEHNPALKEAAANLAFIQRKEGAITPNLSAQEEWITWMPYRSLLPIAIVSGAILTAGISLLMLTRRRKALTVTVSTLAGLVLVLSLANYIYYPHLPDTLTAAERYYVLEATPARTSADPSGSPVIQLTPSTPLIVLAKRGAWTYIETFTGTRGWVATKDIASVAP